MGDNTLHFKIVVPRWLLVFLLPVEYECRPRARERASKKHWQNTGSLLGLGNFTIRHLNTIVGRGDVSSGNPKVKSLLGVVS